MKLSRHIELENIKNCRDLGGIVNEDGRVIKSNKIFRSNLLQNASESDIKTLLEEGLTDVLDLRGDREAGVYPDPVIEGVNAHRIPMHILNKPDWDKYEHYPHTSYLTEHDQMDYLQEWLYVYSNGSANTLMGTSYYISVGREDMKDSWASSLRLLLNAKGALLFHCQDGKDRTGVLAMLILKLLKVDDETIRQEYILSKTYLKDKIDACWQQLLDHNVPEPIRSEIIKVQGSEFPWIDGALCKFHELGGYPTYFTETLGLTEEEIKAFQDKFLE